MKGLKKEMLDAQTIVHIQTWRMVDPNCRFHFPIITSILAPWK